MNEWLGITLVLSCFIAFLVLKLLLSRLKQPYLTYSRLISCVLLMVLVWGFAEKDTLPYQMGLTALALFNAVMAIKEYRKLNIDSGSGQA